MSSTPSFSHLITPRPLIGWLKRYIPLVLIIAAFTAAIVSYITITGSDAPLGLKPKRVNTLLIVNVALLVLLAGIIASRVWGLWHSLRAGSAGSRLQKRIVVLFSTVAITPTIIVSIFSALFFNLGIQNWFNDRVQTAVQESLAVAEAYLAEHKENIRGDALAMASDLNQAAELAITDLPEFNRLVMTQSALRVLTEAIVFKHNRIIAQGRLSFALAFEHIPQELLDRANQGEAVIMTTDDDKVRALVKLTALDDTYLLVGRLIDSKVVDHMQSAQGAVKEYDALKNQLDRLQAVFSVVFVTLALLLLLAAVGYGMVFAGRLTNPISGLVTAAERVRAGDFSVRISNVPERDEIGMLARAFNRMTEQLEAQRTELIEANRRLDERRRFSEAVLSGVSAGVIALDPTKAVTLFNRSATAILARIDQVIEPGMTLTVLLPGIEELLVQAEHLPSDVAQNTLTLTKDGKSVTLHVRVGIEQKDEVTEGYIVTFDDITLLVSAQRTAAWADVARRIAHEIKNPLTPIQLAAERLKRKYLKFITEDQDNFVKYTDTIGKHVGDIGKMVEEFVSFARMPTPKFADEDLSAILKKAVFSAQVANPSVDYQLELPPEPVTMHCDERQISQVLTNILKNAAEAVEAKLVKKASDENKIKESVPSFLAAGQDEDGGKIRLRLACENNAIQVTVEDNGTGFPAADIQTMLEPYVTTRAKGTGLGLAIVRKIVEDHKGSIKLENISGGGARVALSFLQQCDIKAANLGDRV